jgi:hypothetical protein
MGERALGCLKNGALFEISSRTAEAGNQAGLAGSSPVVKTGIVVVTALAARAETVPPVAAPHCFVNINA